VADDNDRRRPGDSEVHRRKRGKNLAMLAALLAFIVILFFVTLVRMGG
jgi:hypothetical protein